MSGSDDDLGGLAALLGLDPAAFADDLRRLVDERLVHDRVPVEVWGVVAGPVTPGSSPGQPTTCRFTPKGAASSIGPVVCLSTYSPTVGDTAMGLKVGTDLFLVGSRSPDGWHAVGGSGQPAFQNAWAAAGGAYSVPRFRRQPNGMVVLSGLAQNASALANSVVFTLPAGFRPSGTESFGTWHYTGSAYVVGRVDVTSAGAVTAGVSQATVYCPLSGITFLAEE